MATTREIPSPSGRSAAPGYLLPGVLLLVFWWLLYRSLLPFAKWVTYSVLSLDPVSIIGSAVEFFLYDAPKVLLLLTLVVFGKGAALGTVLAFMMAVIGLSLPEMIILRTVLKLRRIATFAGVVGAGILIVGYLFNALL